MPIMINVTRLKVSSS